MYELTYMFILILAMQAPHNVYSLHRYTCTLYLLLQSSLGLLVLVSPGGVVTRFPVHKQALSEMFVGLTLPEGQSTHCESNRKVFSMQSGERGRVGR